MNIFRKSMVFILILIAKNIWGQCENSGFENGNFQNWTGYTGSCCGINTPQLGLVPGQHTITNTASGFDQTVAPCFNLPVVAPGSNYSCQLGNPINGSQAERLQFDFLVTPESNLIIYKYAVVLEDPGHDVFEQPRFEAQVLTQNGNAIPCTYYQVAASGNIPGFQSCGGVVFKDWTIVGVDVSAYMGQTVTLDLATGDCALGGHFGYAYVDALCTSLRLDARFCEQANSATISAPDGFSYLWSTGETSQEIVINNPVQGQAYTCQLTSVTGCQAVLSNVMEFSSVDAQFEVESICTNNLSLLNTSINNNGFTESLVWTVNSVDYVNNDSLFVNNLTPGIYSIKLLAISDLGCVDSVESNIEVFREPEMELTITQDCFSMITIDTQILIEDNPITNIELFFNNVNVPSINVGTFNVEGGNNLSNNFQLITTDNIGCKDTLSESYFSPYPLSSEILYTSNYTGFNISCFGLNDGSAEIQILGGIPPYSVQWSTSPPQFGFNANNLYAGEVELLIIDENNCQISDTANLTEPTPLVGTLDILSDYNGFEISCYQGDDGIISLTASGGVGPYNILFNNGLIQNGEVLNGLSEQQLNYSISDANSCVEVGLGSLNDPPQLSSVISLVSDYNGSTISCHDAADGQAEIQVAGGVSPYSYLWSDGATNSTSNADLPVGIATVAVTDLNGCPLSNQINLTAPPIINLTANITSDFNGFSVSCYGLENGSVNATASGGTAPLSYWWSNGTSGSVSQNLSANLITAYVTDINLCDTLDFILNLTEPTELVMNTFQLSDYNGYEISCYGFSDGSISLNPTGGVPPFNYLWNNGTGNQSSSSGLSEGVQTVIVTDDNNCILQSLYVLDAPPQMSAQISTFPDTCYRSQGHAIAIANGGVSPYTYLWNNQMGMNHFYGLLGGSNSLTLYDLNNCSLDNDFTIGNLDAPVADMLIQPESNCSFSQVFFNDMSLNNPVEWKWTIEGVGESENQSESFFFPEPGEYTVNLMVKNQFDCIDDTTAVFSIRNQDLRVFVPNTFTPNGDNVNDVFKPVTSGLVNYTLSVFNRWGEIVYKGNESNEGWLGDRNGDGTICQFDIYYYSVLTSGICEEKAYEGYVLLCE
jgi:gliding motility-associated-like protein